MKKKQSGVQFQRPEARRIGLLMSDAEIQRSDAKSSEEDHAKLLMLCKLYGIGDGPKMFYDLALALARELYPKPKSPGADSKWTSLNRGALVVEIERLVKSGVPARGASWAAAQLAKREPWRSFLGRNTAPAEALRKAYQDFKDDKWAAVMRDAFKKHKHYGALAEWDARVADVVKKSHPE